VTIRRLVALPVLAAVIGCGEDDGGAAAGGPTFEDVTWALETGPSATFADGTVSGSAGCNRYTYRATYETDGATITIGESAATERACTTPEGVVEQEQAYLSALPLAASYTVEGDRLSLLTTEGTYVAIYERSP
jgi:heat shock protein HslJ